MAPPTGTLPPCRWSERSRTLWEFIKCSDAPVLPQVAKISPGSSSVREIAGLDWEVPFLLYSHRRRTRICADHVSWNQENKRFVKLGGNLEIPKDYPGWFQVVDEKTGEPTSHGCDTVESIVESRLSQVLLVRDVASGFKETTDGRLVPYLINAGEILKIGEIWTKNWKVRSGYSESIPSTKLLRCHDLSRKTLHLPVAHPGISFSLIGSAKDSGNPKLVYQIQSAFEQWKPKTVIKLLFGFTPQIIEPFTGFVRLKGTAKPDCAIVYNYQKDKDVFMELPIDINVKVQIAENHTDFIKCEAYQSSLDVCQKQVYPYVVNIKSPDIAYHPLSIQPVTNEKGEQGVRIKAEKDDSNHNARTMYMCPARDMASFQLSDIFPNSNRKYVSNTWKIIYRDPEHIYDDYKNIELECLDAGTSDKQEVPENQEFDDDQAMLQHVFLQMSLTSTLEEDDARSVSSKVSGRSKGSRGSVGRRSIVDVFASNGQDTAEHNADTAPLYASVKPMLEREENC